MFSTTAPSYTDYGCVVVWTNNTPPQPAQVGDALKQYVLAGGRVVIATYGYSAPANPWELQGGIMEHSFSPFVLTSNRQFFPPDKTLNFGTALLSHPIMTGVTDFTYGGNSNYVDVTLDPGATLIGSNNDGAPVIGINAAGNVVGINLYPGGIFTMSPGVFQVFANACAFTQTTPGMRRAHAPLRLQRSRTGARRVQIDTRVVPPATDVPASAGRRRYP
jgi:hypothetical protein